MAKHSEQIDNTIKPVKTQCWLVSRANYLIEVQCNGQTLFIQPFGKVKVVKEDTIVKDTDARQLSFVKIR